MISRIKNFFINGFKAVKISNKQDIKNIYQGNVALVYTFWILPLVLVLPVDLCLRVLDYFVDDDTTGFIQNTIMIVGICLFILYIIVNVFCSIAAWRSSNQYKGRKLWPRLVKFLVIFGCMIIVMLFLFYFALWISSATKRELLASQTADTWSVSANEEINLTSS
jgi:hypothetical protein